MAKALYRRPFDLLVCIFYGFQVPVALFMDSQSVLPASIFPQVALQLERWYIDQYGDPIVSDKPAWFRGCVLFEFLVQVPFWAVATYAIARDRPWIRLPNLVFALCSLTIMLPIVSEVVLSTARFSKPAVLSFYAPFVVLPALIAIHSLVLGNWRTPSRHVKNA